MKDWDWPFIGVCIVLVLIAVGCSFGIYKVHNLEGRVGNIETYVGMITATPTNVGPTVTPTATLSVTLTPSPTSVPVGPAKLTVEIKADELPNGMHAVRAGTNVKVTFTIESDHAAWFGMNLPEKTAFYGDAVPTPDKGFRQNFEWYMTMGTRINWASVYLLTSLQPGDVIVLDAYVKTAYGEEHKYAELQVVE